MSSLHCLTRGVVNKKCDRKSAIHIIKSGLYARIKAKAAVCTLQVRPPNRSQGSPLSSPNEPAEHKSRTGYQHAPRSVHRRLHALRPHAPRPPVLKSHTETALSKRARRLVLRGFQPFDLRTKPDESPVEMNWGPPVEAVGRPT